MTVTKPFHWLCFEPFPFDVCIRLDILIDWPGKRRNDVAAHMEEKVHTHFLLSQFLASWNTCLISCETPSSRIASLQLLAITTFENVDGQNFADGDQADATVHESAFGLQHSFTWQLFSIGRDASCALPWRT